MTRETKIEIKFADFNNDKIKIEGCQIRGYASVFDVIDNHNDIVKKGAFLDSIEKHYKEKRVKLLWQHNCKEPIGVIEKLYEDDYGLYIVASLNKSTQKGQEVISLIQQQAI